MVLSGIYMVEWRATAFRITTAASPCTRPRGIGVFDDKTAGVVHDDIDVSRVSKRDQNVSASQSLRQSATMRFMNETAKEIIRRHSGKKLPLRYG